MTFPKNADLLVLESDWGEDLRDCTSTSPFFEGLTAALGLVVVFRSFHSGGDLEHWLRQVFLSRRRPRIVYISSHGSPGCLHPSLAKKGVRLRSVVAAAAKGTRRTSRRGLLLGACEIGCDIEGILMAA